MSKEKTFPIKIHVSERRAKEGQQILNSMICNYDRWKRGRESLNWKLGEHISNNVELIIDPSILND